MTKIDEFNKKWHDNYKVEGFGIEGMTVSFPCPFCAEPGFAQYKLMDMEKVMSKGNVCEYCKRGMKAVFVATEHGVQIEQVQTCGPDLPDWYYPKMRRAMDDNSQ